MLVQLCQQVAEDLQKRGYAGRTVGVKLRYTDFQIVTRDNTLEVAVNDAQAIRKAAFEAFSKVAPQRRLARAIRLIGVRIGSLSPEGALLPAPVVRGPTLELF